MSSISMAILRDGIHPKQWQIELVDSALPRTQDIYQQRGPGIRSSVVHACINYGEPFDSQAHRAADAALEAAERLQKKPRTKSQKEAAFKLVRAAWESV